MEGLRIPVWLIAVTLLSLVGIVFYSVATGRPIYINGEPWGVGVVEDSDDDKALRQQIESLTATMPMAGSDKIAGDLASFDRRIALLEGEPRFGGIFQKPDTAFGRAVDNPLTQVGPSTIGSSCTTTSARSASGRGRVSAEAIPLKARARGVTVNGCTRRA